MATGAFSILRHLSTVFAIGVLFILGLGTTVYLSLRSPEVKVPDVVGRNRVEAEQILGDAGLNFRVRGARPSGELKPDTVVFQLPRPGEVVKVGQTIAMDISRGLKEGESSEAVITAPTPETKPDNTASSRNTNDANANENKPKRNKNTNKNANENANTANSNANANRPPANRNANTVNVNTSPNANTTRPAANANANRGVNANANRGANQNENRRPPAPKPSPVTPNR